MDGIHGVISADEMGIDDSQCFHKCKHCGRADERKALLLQRVR